MPHAHAKPAKPRSPERPVPGASPAAAAERARASTTREWMESIPAIAWRTDENAVIVERNRHWFDYTGSDQARPPATTGWT
ncbi:MAG: hypothetical protein QM767_02395 [Anaeromyxobacter sp.]